MRTGRAAELVLGMLALSVIAALPPTASARATGPGVGQGSPDSVAAPGDRDAVCAQNNNAPNFQGITAQNFGIPYQDLDSFGAADFRLAHRCKVAWVNISGISEDDAKAAKIWIYRNGPGDLPPSDEPAKCKAKHLAGGPSFAIPVTRCRLDKGRYWLVAQVTMSTPEGQWIWATTEEQVQLADAWKNPRDGFGTGCTDWEPLGNCIGLEWDYLYSIE